MHLFDQIFSKIHAIIPNQQKRKLISITHNHFKVLKENHFLTWHLRVNLNKWMKMESVRKNQVKKKKTKIFFLMIMMKDNIYIYIY
jgi:plasmid maintenance system killer protein